MCSVGWGAYSSANVESLIGGYGTVALSASSITYNQTGYDATNIITYDCTLSSIRIAVYRQATASDVDSLYVKILRRCLVDGTDDITGTYVKVVYDRDILPEVILAAKNGARLITIEGLSWSVKTGDYFGYFLPVLDAGSRNSLIYTAVGTSYLYCYIGGNKVVADSPVLISSYATGNNRPFVIEAYSDNNEKTLINQSMSGMTDGSIIPIPYYTGVGQYIILEKVKVPDGENLLINLQRTDATTAADTTEAVIDVNFITDTINLGAASKSLAGQDNNEIDIHIWLDPVNNKLKVKYVNYDTGQGISDRDFKNIDLTDRVPVAITSGGYIRRILLTNAGGNATISKLTVCNKPVLALGHSFFGSQSVGKSVLVRVGAKLDDSGIFSEQRYVINASIAGNGLLNDTPLYSTALLSRWDSDSNDLIDYNDVIDVILTGLNDITSYSPVKVASGIETIVTDAKANGNDVILCELIPIPDGTAANREKLDYLNHLLVKIADDQSVPIALVYTDYTLTWYEDLENRIHPDATGSAYIANAIVTAYESNSVPTAEVYPEPNEVEKSVNYGYSNSSTGTYNPARGWLGY